MEVSVLTTLLCLVFAFLQGKCNESGKSGILEDEKYAATMEPEKEYSLYDALDPNGRIAFIVVTCILGAILFTMCGCYCHGRTCRISFGRDRAPSPPVAVVARSELQTLNEIHPPGLSQGLPGHPALTNHASNVSQSRSLCPAQSSSQPSMEMRTLSTQHLMPSNALWRYHSTGRITPGHQAKENPWSGLLSPRHQAYGHVTSRYPSTGLLQPGYLQPSCSTQEHLTQRNAPLESLSQRQSFGQPVSKCASTGFLCHPRIEIHSPSPLHQEHTQSISRCHSEGRLAAGYEPPGLPPLANPSAVPLSSTNQDSAAGYSLSRYPSTGLLCPVYPQPGHGSEQHLPSGGEPMLECPMSQPSRVEPSAPSLDLI